MRAETCQWHFFVSLKPDHNTILICTCTFSELQFNFPVFRDVGTDDMEYMMKVTAVLLFLHLAKFGKMHGCIFLPANFC